MSFGFNPETLARIQQLLTLYPDPNAAILPALHIAQEQYGYVDKGVMEAVAEVLGVPEEHVVTSATFYTMYNKRPVGRYHVQVCGNVSCWLRGSNQILEAFESVLGIHPGETTTDGLFTLSVVQCLASCGTGPAVQINADYHESMTPEKVAALVSRLRSGGRP